MNRFGARGYAGRCELRTVGGELSVTQPTIQTAMQATNKCRSDIAPPRVREKRPSGFAPLDQFAERSRPFAFITGVARSLFRKSISAFAACGSLLAGLTPAV